MNIQIKKLFGPIRRCVQINNEFFSCAVPTPGLTRSMLNMELTHNNLCVINGERDVYEDGVLLYRCLMHEAIHLPLRVKMDTVRLETKDGLSIMTCSIDPPAHPPSGNIFKWFEK